MKYLIIISRTCMLFVVSFISVQWAGGDFSRYQVILDRRPFGEPPAVVEEPAAPSRPSGPSYFERVRLVAITTSRGGTRVGFVDNNVTPARTYFLFVGDAEDQFRVLSADYESETALVERDGEQRTLRMGGGGGVQPRTTPGPGMIAGGARPVTGDDRDAARRGRPIGRISEGRRQRMEEERRRMEHVPELTGAVLERHLQEYNLQVIREGMPPLPIPLTPEQDAQLVEEGVLPPLE